MKTKINYSILVIILGIFFSVSEFNTANAQTMTITLKNNNVITYDLSASSIDSVRYVGGEFGTDNGVGVKIYFKGGKGVSVDYLYSQIISISITSDETPKAPVITPNGGIVTAATAITITAEDGATIYYTINGNTPSTSSTLYSAPFTLTESATVKAIAVKDGKTSELTSATFIVNNTADNNVNANWHSENWVKNNGSMSYTPKTAGMWRLEVPHLSDKSNTSWSQKSEDDYGICFALEWDNDLIANRWTCYQLHKGNNVQNVGREDSFKEDGELPSNSRSTLSDYQGSGFSRGHLCPSGDRRGSSAQQALTYYLSNMQPQYQSHNGSQWANLEGDVRTWSNMDTCDTLYVVKAATIENVIINGTTKSGLKSVKCNDRLPVPEYFYMALLAYSKSSEDCGDGVYHGTFHAIGIWTYHYNDSSEKQNAEYITIDELEARTGIDFFCNLPDNIENEVESTLQNDYWSSGASLNR